jgi:DNA-binding response OmpR family regulator
MLPKTLALIDDDKDYTQILSQFLKDAGIKVDVFDDSNDLLTHPDPYAYGFYIVDLILPGVNGVQLIELIRKRSDAGLLVLSGRLAADTFKEVIEAGADMYLAKPAQFEQIQLAIRAVQRRAAVSHVISNVWTLDRRLGHLTAPDDAHVELSEIDIALLECFVEAEGAVVSREALLERLGRRPEDHTNDGLNATIYRLRRRIERATPIAAPLQSRSRVGYIFKATLKVI